MVQSSAIFGKYGDEWMIGFDSSETIPELRHHAIAYGISPQSDLFKENGLLEDVQHGDIIYDCAGVTTDRSVAPKIMYSEQVGNQPLDLLSMFDENNSTANGYSYGIPVGARTGISWWAIEVHVHADMIETDEEALPIDP